MGRNYRNEYDRYQGSDTQKKRRAGRNKVRRSAEKAGLVSKGDNKDIHHKDGNPMNSSLSNLAVQDRSKNRSFARTANARKA
tara:strand:+ start:271 stop:516 length:246 start_codon:yes stop_codon:yes gene_type:complete